MVQVTKIATISDGKKEVVVAKEGVSTRLISSWQWLQVVTMSTHTPCFTLLARSHDDDVRIVPSHNAVSESIQQFILHKVETRPCAG